MPWRSDARFQEAVETVLRHEGGLVDHPNDPGGVTKYGISLRAFPHLGREGIINLTVDQAKDIYFHHYWRPNRYAEIQDPAVSTKVFDLAVNVGAVNANRILQRAVNWLDGSRLKVDGIVGSKTLAATNQCDPVRLLQTIRWHAAEYYYQLARARNDLRPFLLGWLNRAYA
ncbi:MAG: hypothetical protein BAA04_01715 [Firmicutes bacterium ZCTH02-B6]|nr:MAG: hypothetical protein BAA04_01715 [Firmicutes bacterium ZCTH02-B6]